MRISETCVRAARRGVLLRAMCTCAALAVILASGCSDSPAQPHFPLVTGRALYETSYENYAWGYQLHGLVVFDNGAILTYATKGSSWYWNPKQQGVYTMAELSDKFSHGTVYRDTLRTDTLALMRTLATAAFSGSLSPLVQRMADAGSWRSVMYEYDAKTGTYHETLLRLRGDFEQDNLAPEAAHLADILDSLARSYFPIFR